jgi:hypothetical protein
VGYRSFKDRSGRPWEVWEVHPIMAERRAAKQEVAVPVERRSRSEARSRLPAELRNGWLAFECQTERRRLAPTPEGWTLLSDEALAALLERAVAR